ncbi:MAG: MFS transporter [Bryobacteraceae bacterium]
MNEKPTKVRHWVLFIMCLMYMITYLARVNISAAAPAIMKELNLTKVQMGIAFTAFVFPYAVFQLPVGMLGDKYGPRKVLSLIVLLWSVFTGATALAWNLASLVVIRFCFGIGEAGAFPNATRAFSHWMPTTERAFAGGITHAAARVASGLTPVIVVAIMVRWGWRSAFVIFSMIGILWSVFWFVWYRDTPAKFNERWGGINQAEIDLINGGVKPSQKVPTLPFTQLIKSKNLWFLGLSNFMYSFAFWIYLAWLPTYLVEARGFSMLSMSLFASLPMLAGAAGDAIGGWLSDKLWERTNNAKFSRRSVPIFGLIMAALLMTPGAMTSSPYMAIFLLTGGMFGLEIAVGAYWAVCLDIGQESSGSAAGMMSCLGNTGSAISPLVFGVVVQYTGSWVYSFVIASVLLVVGAALWMWIDPELSLGAERALRTDRLAPLPVN